MVSITHRIGIEAPLSAVRAAVSTVEGISEWWTRDVVVNADKDNVLDVHFRDLGGNLLGSMAFQVSGSEANTRVKWLFESGPKEWIGTEVIFDLQQRGDFTIILFGHNHWREAVEFMAHCSMKWATFLLSLRAFLETGTGRPSPGDLKIDDWN